MSAKTNLYERDFYAWTREQAELLRAGKISEADLENIAEEIDSMGKTEKRELISRLTILLLHLAKWRFQQGLRGRSWRLSIEGQRLDIADLIDDNPSLKPYLTNRSGPPGAALCSKRKRKPGSRLRPFRPHARGAPMRFSTTTFGRNDGPRPQTATRS